MNQPSIKLYNFKKTKKFNNAQGEDEVFIGYTLQK